MTRTNRGPYSYSADISDTSFRIIATYTGAPDPALPKALSIDQSMQISQE
jgi:hypothetical protein